MVLVVRLVSSIKLPVIKRPRTRSSSRNRVLNSNCFKEENAHKEKIYCVVGNLKGSFSNGKLIISGRATARSLNGSK